MSGANSNSRRRGRVYLRGRTWWTDFSWHGRRYREPAENAATERQAWDELEKRRASAQQGRRLDVDRARFTHLVERFRHHCEAKGTRPRTMARWNQVLAHLEAFFGNDLAREIPERVEAYIVARRAEGGRPATIRLELGLLASSFKVSKLPRLEVPSIEVRNVRKGFLDSAEVAAITTHLPESLRPAVWFAYYTGWRKSELLNLEWRNVDLAGGLVRLDPGTTKSGRGRIFPVGAHPELARLLKEQKACRDELKRETGVAPWWVFHRAGRPIHDMDDAWRTACRKAGVPGRIFHDLRRSAARNLRRLGLSESDIMELCGWETRAMFQRYAIKDESGLADRLRRATSGTFAAQSAVVRGSNAAD